MNQVDCFYCQIPLTYETTILGMIDYYHCEQCQSNFELIFIDDIDDKFYYKILKVPFHGFYQDQKYLLSMELNSFQLSRLENNGFSNKIMEFKSVEGITPFNFSEKLKTILIFL